ncbi:MAG: fatty-acyl-CoA synthase [Halioglobus sp.]|jgi:fatty-acyl-CoA synthase
MTADIINRSSTSPLTDSYFHNPGESPLLFTDIGSFFDAVVARNPDQLALVVSHQNVRVSYKEYQTAINHLSAGLLSLGIKKGDRVGIWGPNSFEWCVTQLATAKIGVILVCLNPAYRLTELGYALNKVECKAIITAESFKQSNYLDMLRELAPELDTCRAGELQSERLPALRHVIAISDHVRDGILNFTQVLERSSSTGLKEVAAIQRNIDPDEPINIQFTSGTTGSPKGATLTHYNVLNNGAIIGAGMQLGIGDKLCIPVPLYHCFGMVLGNLACIAHGATAVLPGQSFDPETTLSVVEAERCTALHGVPTMFIAALEHPRFPEFDLTSLRTGIMAGASCPVEIMKRVIGDMGMTDVLIAYGQTECSPVNHMTAIDDPIDKRVETVGQAGPHLEVKVIDEEGVIVPIGNAGEICCRGYAVMRGYWADEEKTLESIDKGGWLHSGDIGVMDNRGYLSVTGRIKDMIIRGGENIYPREIEEYLYKHPGILEIQVFGVPDPKLGEQVAAWIQLHENSELTELEIVQYCTNQISHFKIPKYIKFVEEYPMTVTGKLQKFVMREQYAGELGLTSSEN